MENTPLTLPDDIIREILSRSSVKTLMRLTCVCEFFRNLITSDRLFAYSHLSRAPRQVIAMTNISVNPAYRWENEEETFLLKFKNKSLSNPLYLERNIFLIGSCNGIICFCREDKFYLWNPSLHQIRAIVLHDIILRRSFIGFGYDSKNQDHKLVYIHSESLKAEIYSLKNDSWKSLSYHLPTTSRWYVPRTPLEFNGSLHWIYHTSRPSVTSIIKFGISDETVSELETPVPYGQYCSLGVLKGCMSLLKMCFPKFEIWSMIENGECSWIKNTFEFRFGRPVKWQLFYNDDFKLTADGKISITGRGDSILYDPETKGWEIMKIDASGSCLYRCYSVDYVESLIPVNPPLS